MPVQTKRRVATCLTALRGVATCLHCGHPLGGDQLQQLVLRVFVDDEAVVE